MNPLKVDIDPLADADLDEQFAYIVRDNFDAAVRFLLAARRDMRKLAERPGLGPKREFGNPRLKDIRSWPITGFRNHLIFYRPIEGGIQVIRVLYGARDIETIFE